MFAAAFDRHQMFAHLPGCEGNAGVACKLDTKSESKGETEISYAAFQDWLIFFFELLHS